MPESHEQAYAEAFRDLATKYERLVQQLSILRQIDELDDPLMPLKEVFRRLLETLALGVAAENSSLMLYDEKTERLELCAAFSPFQEHGKSFEPGEWSGKTFVLGEGVIGQVAKMREAARMADAQTCPNFIPVCESPVMVRSLMCFPLVVDDRLIGVLNLSHRRPNVFSLENEQVLHIVVDRAARFVRTHLLRDRMRISEEHYRLVSHNAGDAILVWEEPNRVVDANPAAEALSGIPIAHLVSGERRWLEGVHRDDRAAFAGHREEVLTRQHPATIEYRYTDDSGQTRLLEQHSAPMPVSKNARPRMVGVIRDATSRKRAEEALLAASRMEATATLAGGIAHEFNNMMMAVLGSAELLQLEVGDIPSRASLIETIVDAATRAGELTRQMLAFARGGKYMVKVVNLNAILRQILWLEERSIRDGVTVERDFDPQLWNIRGDPDQITQVIMNLSLNAVEAIEGEGNIHIATRNVVLDEDFALAHEGARPGPHAVLSVTDDGCGMGEQTRAHVFEPFFTTKFQGRGLGLAAVFGIVQNHDGCVVVKSRRGAGSCFEVYFPAVDGEIEKAVEHDGARQATT